MTCGMHEYYLVLHVHIHITSKNGDVCKLCATERFFRLTWPQLWRHRSNVRGVRVLKFSGGRKKDGPESYKKWWHSTGKQKRYSRKTAGRVASTPLCRRGLINLRPAGEYSNTPRTVFCKWQENGGAGFSPTLSPIFWQLLWKFRSWVIEGQVTRSGQVTTPYKNFTIAPQLVFEGM